MIRWATVRLAFVLVASLATQGHAVEIGGVVPAPPAGAKCDARSVSDGAMSAGLTTLTSASARFTAADVGKTVSVAGAGADGAALVTTIAGFVSATRVATAASATRTVKGAPIYWGTDDAMALPAALTTANGNGVGATVSVPPGMCLSTTSLGIYARTTLVGRGRMTSHLVFTGTGDGIKSTWPINSSTAVWIRLAHLALIGANSATKGAGFADVGGSFVSLDDVYVQGFAYGVIFDQTEVSEIRNSQLEQQTKGGIWLVNGPDH